MLNKIQIIKGNITQLKVDAIVNAANKTLLGGSGVDGAIHRAAGSGLFEECRKLDGCSTGQARITLGYDLSSDYVIHTVGPIWQGGNAREAELLASCYRASLKLAVQHPIKSIAFPAISCGIYGYPIQEAVAIAVKEVMKFLQTHQEIEKIIFCCFGEKVFQTYCQEIKKYQQ